MLLKCAVIDDDKLFTKVLEHYIEKVDFLELAGVYHDANTALQINFGKIDFLFLDVELPGISGLEFLQSLTVRPPAIIVSQKKEYGADAFDNDSIDYLHKPVSLTRFLKATNKVRKYFEDAKKPETRGKQASIFIRQDRIWIRIPVIDILYIKADNNDVLIKTYDKVYKTHNRMRDIISQLPEKDFVQVHRSYIVQLDKIDKVDGEIIEINSRTIPVSKTYLKEMYRRLNIRS